VAARGGHTQRYQAPDNRGFQRGRSNAQNRGGGQVQAAAAGDSTLTWPSSLNTTGGNTIDYASLCSAIGNLRLSMEEMREENQATAAQVAALHAHRSGNAKPERK